MPNRLYIDTGMRIQVLRAKRGYTREALAEKVHISDKFLYEIENGKTGFTAMVLKNIAEALQVNCDYLLMGEREKGSHHTSLMAALELFDEGDTDKLIRLLEAIYEFKNQQS